MLNPKTNERELAYVVKIDAIEPITGSDNCEAALVGGWHIMTRKGTFKPGDLAIYFEIDSHLDTSKPEFAFLESKHGNIKTQKYTFGGKGNFISQGLLMSHTDFGWEQYTTTNAVGADTLVIDTGEYLLHEHDFLTKELGVTYAVAEDNARKSNSDKYKVMAARRPALFKRKWARWMMNRTWGKKVMFFFFGKKKDKKNEWPEWVKKTDEERIECCPYLLNDGDRKWILTEKLDGSSTTFALRGTGRKQKFYVCSRNVVFDTSDKACYYDSNIYWEMATKYNMRVKLNMMMDMFYGKPIDYIIIQAETYGNRVQKRDYGMTDHDMAIFNVIFGYKDGSVERLNPIEGRDFVATFGLPYVPVLSEATTLPNDVDAVKALSHGKSRIDGGMREGIVCRSTDGVYSFKAVDPEFLLKYHN